MKTLINLFVVIGLALSITSCATGALKAPCDHQGHLCGQKIKINQW